MSELDIETKSFQSLGETDRQQLLSMFKKGASRRQVMGWLMAAGASATMAGTIAGGAHKAFAATPKKGGKITIAGDQHGPADTVDPILQTGAIDYFRTRMFYGSLVRLTSNLGYEPELATEILPNSDATEWTFKLRKGVEFHNGKSLTADDVLYTMSRHMGKDNQSKAASLVSMVEKVEKVNSHEVKMVLSSPNADLPQALGTFHFKIVQDGVTDFSTAVGTGPFTCAEFKPGVRAIAKKFNNYWGDGPYLDEIEHYGIGDSVARLNAFLAGDIDMMANLPPKAIEQVEATPGKDVWSTKSSAYITIACRRDMQPSGNIDLIRAMQYLMDRERLVKGVFKGQSTVGNDQPIGPSYFDYCGDIAQRTLDLDKAKYHFQKSGIGSTEIPVIASEVSPGCVEQCLFLQREAQKIGMNIKVNKVTTDGYWGAVWLKEPICVVSWNMRPTANIMMTLAYKSDAPWNETYWKNEKFDQLLVAVRGVTDPAVRKQMYCDMQTMIHEESGSITPAFRNYVDAINTNIKGRTSVPLNAFGGAECPEYLWIDA